MKITVYTLFPQLLEPWTRDALLGRAIERGLIQLSVRDLRSFAEDKHRSVDDAPYGGGAGMVIRVDIAARAIEEARAGRPPPEEIILLSPAGEQLTQELVERLATRNHLCLLAGRYEGFDSRVESLVTREVSIGDFVMMGGEVAALALIEATVRLLPGVLGTADSHRQDSFTTGLLDHPNYTRPPVFAGLEVPQVLLSGHHADIARWRRQQALIRTRKRRPDLLRSAVLSEADRGFLEELQDAEETVEEQQE